MLGWSIHITRAKEGKDAKGFANFEVGVYGLGWLKKLVDSGHAVQTTSNGYPNTYYVSARVLLPIITGGIPRHDSPFVIGDDYILPERWSSDIKWNEAEVLACPPDEMLRIEAWDES